jgi:hypothetical protein
MYISDISDVKSAHTHLKCFVWGCKVLWPRGEGRRDLEGME